MYVGEGYPLCSDLPAQHFLKAGATFLFLGADSSPERLQEPSTWHKSSAKRLSLPEGSKLAEELCSLVGKGKNKECTFPTKVTLNQDLACTGIECEIDALRTFEVQPGIFYEYIRAPCVHQAFYNDAKLISRIKGSQGKHICGDPRMESASTTCCVNPDDETSSRSDVELFSGERVSFDKASERCVASGKQLCLTPFPSKTLSDSECAKSAIGGCDQDGMSSSLHSCFLALTDANSLRTSQF